MSIVVVVKVGSSRQPAHDLLRFLVVVGVKQKQARSQTSFLSSIQFHSIYSSSLTGFLLLPAS